MPFTANRQFKAAPRLLAGASGMYYRMADGREILDGTAGLWCVNAGHCRAEIADAIARQARALDYATAFQMGHPQAFALAARLARLAPGDLDHVFYVNSGSEAVETALKIALAYHHARGETGRVRLVGRERGYHGVNFGGMSVGGIPQPQAVRSDAAGRRPSPPYPRPRPQRVLARPARLGRPSRRRAHGLIARHGADTIAAVIVEPMAGSTGVLVPPQGYLERLRAICDAHGILLIFDEVITGFGRLGQGVFARRQRHAEAPEAGDHLVEDQQDAVRVADRAQALEVALRRRQHAGRARHRLDDHGGDGGGAVQRDQVGRARRRDARPSPAGPG